MKNKRLQKIERFLQKAINELFRLQIQQLRKSIIISVTSVRVSSDLSSSKIFLSIYPSDNETEIMNEIKKNKNIFRYHLGTRIGHQIKHIPDLKFFIDDSFDYVENINRLIN